MPQLRDLFNISKSSYINHLLQSQVETFQQKPLQYLDIPSIQSEAGKILGEDRVKDIDMGKIFSGVKNKSENPEEEELNQKFFSLVLTKLYMRLRESAYQQFVDYHADNCVNYTVITEPTQIFDNFFNSFFSNKRITPESQSLVSDFEAYLRPKFEAKVLGLDDISLEPQKTHYKAILLEDSQTVVLEKTPSKFHDLHKILHNLLIKDKEVQERFLNIFTHTLSKVEQTKSIIPLVISSLLEDLNKRFEKEQRSYSELSVSKLVEMLQKQNNKVLLDNKILNPKEFEVALINTLQEKQFLPEIEKKSLYRKLGI